MTTSRGRALFVTVLAVAAAWAAYPAAAQSGDQLPDSTYDMYYPKRASGYQPVAWDVGETDDVNLYNGNVLLTIPLGPPLEAGADLSWQPTLYYNSKIWANDRRDLVHHDTGGACWRDEGRGIVLGDPWIGAGWRLSVPHIYIQRHQKREAECGGFLWQCYDLRVAAVVTEDGGRHALTPCPLWEPQCTPDGDRWYAADGSGWRVTWHDDDGDGEFSEGDRFTGERGGLKYTFAQPFLMRSAPGSLGVAEGRSYYNDARGFYLTRIESARWPGPAIEVDYAWPGSPAGSETRIPYVIRADAGDAGPTTLRSLELVRCGENWPDGEAPFCSGSAPTRPCLDCDPPPPGGGGGGIDTGPVAGVIAWAGPPDTSPPLVAYAFQHGSLTGAQALRILEDPSVTCPDQCAWGNHCDDPTWNGPSRSFGATTLASVTMLERSGGAWAPALGGAVRWSFQYRPGDGPPACEPCPPPPGAAAGAAPEDSPREMREAQGVLTRVTLPNGTAISYTYAPWVFVHHRPTVGGVGGTPCRVWGVVEGAGGSAPYSPPPPDWEPCLAMSLGADPTVGVVDRRVMKGGAVLEWTEYLAPGAPPWYVKWSGRRTPALDLDGDAFGGSTSSRLYLGFVQRVVRRHLVVGRQPGDPADGPPDGLAATPPAGSLRYDDTIHVFANGTVVYDADGDTYVDGGDTFGRLPLEGRELMVRRYRGDAGGADGTFSWWEDGAPEPVEVEYRSYTLAYRHAAGVTSWQSPYEIHEASSGTGPVPVWAGLGRPRRVVTRQVAAALGASPEDRWLAREWRYETDAGVAAGSHAYPWNAVWERRLLEPSATEPVAATGWVPAAYRERSTRYEEGTPDPEATWLTSLPAEEAVTERGALARRETTVYDGWGRATSVRRHVTSTGDHGDDVVEGLAYYTDPADPDRYGRLRVKTLRLGSDWSAFHGTGYDWSHGRLAARWRLCRALGSSCSAWPAAPGVLGLYGWHAELEGRAGYDAYWWRPVWVKDGSGDGIRYIGYDLLGRTTRVVPTSCASDDPPADGSGCQRSPTWIAYPDLSTTEVSVVGEGASGRGKQVVARYEFDGLGRIVHAARRREGTTGFGYAAWEFRHKTFYRDGVGTVWAESHWTSSALGAPGSLEVHPDFELVAEVDALGRPVRRAASDGGERRYRYRGRTYGEERVLESSSVLRRRVERRDGLGRVAEVWEAKAPGLGTVYSAFPTAWELGDRARYVRSGYVRDGADRLVRVEVQGRDGSGAVRTQVRTWSYDALGRLKQATAPEWVGATVWGSWDVFGNAGMVTLPGGQRIRRTYDPAGREVLREAEAVCADGAHWIPLARWSYGTSAAAHAVGKLVAAERYNLLEWPVCGVGADGIPPGSVRVDSGYTYGGAQGELTRRAMTVRERFYGGQDRGFNVDYGYDLWGNVARITYPWRGGLPGPVVSYDWDAVGLREVRDETDVLHPKELVAGIEYHAATGMPVWWRTPAGPEGAPGWMWHQVSVDGTRPRVLRMALRLGGKTGTSLWGTGTYTYDAGGNVTGIGPGESWGWAYTYDGLGRLVEATTGGVAHDYTYDDFGNLLTLRDAPLEVEPASNRLALSMAQLVAYDRRGGVVHDQAGGRRRWYRRGPEGEVLGVQLLGRNDRRAFAYDHDGERVAAYTFTGGTLDEVRYTTRDEAGNVLSDILRVDGVFTREADRVYMGRDEQVRLVYGAGGAVTYATAGRDHLGSLRADVGEAEGGRVRLDLWPYGGQFRRRKIGTSTWDLQNGAHVFTGHERDYVGTASGVDPTQGLDYMHARWYSHDLGRFLSPDPVDGDVGLSQSWNRYAYVRGDPVGAVDPDGRLGLDGGLVRYEYDLAVGKRPDLPRTGGPPKTTTISLGGFANAFIGSELEIGLAKDNRGGSALYVKGAAIGGPAIVAAAGVGVGIRPGTVLDLAGPVDEATVVAADGAGVSATKSSAGSSVTLGPVTVGLSQDGGSAGAGKALLGIGGGAFAAKGSIETIIITSPKLEGKEAEVPGETTMQMEDNPPRAIVVNREQHTVVAR